MENTTQRQMNVLIGITDRHMESHMESHMENEDEDENENESGNENKYMIYLVKPWLERSDVYGF